MGLHKISLMDAYLIETLRHNGLTNHELLEGAASGNIGEWQKYNNHFDFSRLIDFAKHDMDGFQEILQGGYKVKFVTINGLQNLIKLVFGKKEDKDFELKKDGITNLVLNKEQLTRLKEMVSSNWVIDPTVKDNNFLVNIRPAQV